jgi:hypothetical protein
MKFAIMCSALLLQSACTSCEPIVKITDADEDTSSQVDETDNEETEQPTYEDIDVVEKTEEVHDELKKLQEDLRRYKPQTQSGNKRTRPKDK